MVDEVQGGGLYAGAVGHREIDGDGAGDLEASHDELRVENKEREKECMAYLFHQPQNCQEMKRDASLMMKRDASLMMLMSSSMGHQIGYIKSNTVGIHNPSWRD